MILITGGAGFIGTNFILNWLADPLAESVVNLDKLTYAGNLESLNYMAPDGRHIFVKGDISDYDLVLSLLKKYSIRAVINFAAESHVDRSINHPVDFINTNIVGTFNLLEAVRSYWTNLSKKSRLDFRFLHISTDEVFGSLPLIAKPFTENNSYKPNSPYSASKAASDHLVRAWHHTYGLPVLITNCSNNYGPYQFPEKLIPSVIVNAICGNVLPIYGDGKQIRDWLNVRDHCLAICRILKYGKVGEHYNIGGHNEKHNIDVVTLICRILDELVPKSDGTNYASQIDYVDDRPGHDLRYAVDFSKLELELKWGPVEDFEYGMRKTVQWYIDNQQWVNRVLEDAHLKKL